MNNSKADPYWEEMAKLPVEEIEKRFDRKTAEALILLKKQNEKQI